MGVELPESDAVIEGDIEGSEGDASAVCDELVVITDAEGDTEAVLDDVTDKDEVTVWDDDTVGLHV